MAYTIDRPYKHEEEIKKSRFLIRAFPLGSEQDFATILAEIKAQGAATHHCFAWKYGANTRAFDDGEPSGTAGRPILAAIEGRDCDRIAIIVTRWYGGIKLGTGGLARAYGGGAARILQQAELVEIVERSRYRLHVPFALLSRIEKILGNFAVQIEDQNFGATGVDLVLTVPQKKAEDLAHEVSDISRGQIIL